MNYTVYLTLFFKIHNVWWRMACSGDLVYNYPPQREILPSGPATHTIFRMAKRMLNFLLWGVAVYLLLGVTLYACQRYLLYHPSQIVPNPADYGLTRVEPVRIATADGLKLFAWWHPPSSSDRPVIVFFHGNAGHNGHRVSKIRPYLDAGYGFLLAGYRYNAGTGGSPSEEGLYEDGRAAFRFLEEVGIASERIVAYGESLGSAVAVTMAIERKVAAVVLESPYTSVVDVAQSHYWFLPTRWLVRDRFDLTGKITRIQAPLLVVHGERDRIIPVQFGRRLFDLAPEPKEAIFVPEGTHNDLSEYGLARHVVGFLARTLGERVSP